MFCLPLNVQWEKRESTRGYTSTAWEPQSNQPKFLTRPKFTWMSHSLQQTMPDEAEMQFNSKMSNAAQKSGRKGAQIVRCVPSLTCRVYYITRKSLSPWTSRRTSKVWQFNKVLLDSLYEKKELIIECSYWKASPSWLTKFIVAYSPICQTACFCPLKEFRMASEL